MDINNIWDLFLEKMKQQINPMHFETWFADTKLISLDATREDRRGPM